MQLSKCKCVGTKLRGRAAKFGGQKFVSAPNSIPMGQLSAPLHRKIVDDP